MIPSNQLPTKVENSAVEDAARIGVEIAQRNPPRAIRFGNEFEQVLRRISSTPEVYAELPYYPTVKRCRFRERFSYMALYRIYPDIVQVFAIVSTRQDPKKIKRIIRLRT